VDWLPVAIVIALAMGFNYTNGFHDAANAIATSVSTRALTPRIALVMAAFFNLLGAFIGTKVASTVGSGIIQPPSGTIGLNIVGSALIGATSWNLLTWWKGLPSSSSHALFGGMVGASLAAGTTVLWGGVWHKIVIPMVISPVMGLILGYLLMTVILWLFRRKHPGRTTRGFRYSQTLSAAAMALGHGLQDAGKTMGIIVLALTVGGYQDGSSIPLWVKISTALVISAGTYSGGWRIMRTLGRKIIHLDPPQGFAAEASGASILYIAGLGFGAPISTTHTITSTIMGVGATKRLTAVRWGVAKNIVSGWVLTFPGAGLVAALAYVVTIPFQP
jgi:inorganic phosphate transporter, PiT family